MNPHYRLMGLHGSEYWTYTLPRRVGGAEAARLTRACLPVSPVSALRSGLVDQVIPGDPAGFRVQVAAMAEQLARSPDYPARLAAKARQLAAAEKRRPLAAYRAAELAVMSRNFTGPDEQYPQLRRAFVYKDKPPCTPAHLARHCTHPPAPRLGQSPARQAAGALTASRLLRGRLVRGGPGGAREGLGAQTSAPVPSAAAAGTQA